MNVFNIIQEVLLIFLLILTFFSCYNLIITFKEDSLYGYGYSKASAHENYLVFVPALDTFYLLLFLDLFSPVIAGLPELPNYSYL